MIKYPNKKISYQTENTSFKKRGMTFEALVDESNIYYRANNIAIIHKKPTPIQIVNVNYPSRNQAKITEAYYKTPSTTDYNGIYKGFYIDFDVKESLSATAFPLKNVHAHQVNHLSQIDEHQGIAFLLIYFKHYDKVYLLKYSDLADFFKRSKTGRQSRPDQEITEVALEVNLGFRPRVDYLKAVDQCIKDRIK